MQFISWDRSRLEELVKLWNSELNADFPMRESLFKQNSFDDKNILYKGSIIAIDERNNVAGFIVSKKWQENVDVEMGKEIGWIQVLLIKTACRSQGIGSTLLRQAETAQKESGAKRILIGCDPYHYFPGIPSQYTDVQNWLEQKGYQYKGKEFDLISHYKANEKQLLPSKSGISFEILEQREREKFLAFLRRCFPGRWEYEAVHYFMRGGNGREFVVMKRENDIIGFCRINDEKSPFIAQNVYWSPLFDESLGGIGPLGIDSVERKKGYGLAIVEAGIHFLRERSINKIVIDWTGLIDFYEKLGYKPWKEYSRYSKEL